MLDKFPFLILPLVLATDPGHVDFLELFMNEGTSDIEKRKALGEISGTEEIIKTIDLMMLKSQEWSRLVKEDHENDQRFTAIEDKLYGSQELMQAEKSELLAEAESLVTSVFRNLEAETELIHGHHHMLIHILKKAKAVGFKDAGALDKAIVNQGRKLVHIHRKPDEDDYLGPQLANASEMEKELSELVAFVRQL